MVPQPLPVPDLQETVDRTIRAATAVVDAAAVQELVAQAREFVAGPGPDLQRRLLEFAQAQNAAGGSYLSRDWLRSYLTTRTALPLTTSVAFQLAQLPLGLGLERVGNFLHRAAVVHMQQLTAQTPAEVDPRGHELDMDQWQILAPGIRHPLPECDALRRPDVPPAEATIGVLHNGRMFSMAIADDDGVALPAAAIAHGVERVLELAKQNCEDTVPQASSFCDLSYLGSQFVGDFLGELIQEPSNADVYEQLTRMLFVVNVLPRNPDAENPSDVQRLRALAFELGHAWAYKPVSYEIAVDSDWLGIHFEHSGADGATIRAAVQRMVDLESSVDSLNRDSSVQPVELTWRYSPDQQRRLASEVERYRLDSVRYAVVQVSVDRPALERLPVKVSEDAAQQLLLTYAQLATFGRVRAAYESVDMREFQAGRTECLRPVTVEAVEFAQALLDGAATVKHCAAAMEAHRNWVKACKTGRGIDRHLLGLELMVAEGQRTPEFLIGHGRRAVGEDFLSTTSLGEARPISGYAFAPVASDTLGVGYVKYSDHYVYVINHHTELSETVATFSRNIRQAAQALGAFINQVV